MSWFNFFSEKNSLIFSKDVTLDEIAAEAFVVLTGAALFVYCLVHLAIIQYRQEQMLMALEPDENVELIVIRNSI